MPGHISHSALAGLPGGRRIVRILVVGCLIVIFAISCRDRSAQKSTDASAAKKPIPVQLIRVEAQEYRRTIESVGSLFPNEEVTVSSEVEGKVEQVLVDVGDRVEKGQPLVNISTVELTLVLAQARAAVQQVRARLGLPEKADTLRDVREAAEVKKALADLSDAEQKYQRAKTLYGQGLLPRETYDETDSRLKAMRAAYDLAVQTVENLQAQLTQYRASMDLAQKKLNDSTIRAPFSGEIKERTVTVGQYLRVQSPVVVIVSVNPLRARLKVPEKMAAWIRVGHTASIAVEAYPGSTFAGRITRLNPSVDQQTRTIEAEAAVANPDGRLRPGFFVKASIPSDRVDRALFLLDRAVLYSYGVYKVFVIEGNKLGEKEVRIGDHSDQKVEIVEGLSEGQGVALPVAGSELRDRAAVEIVQ